MKMIKAIIKGRELCSKHKVLTCRPRKTKKPQENELKTGELGEEH